MVLSTGFRRRKKCDDLLWNHQRSGFMEDIKVGIQLRTEVVEEKRNCSTNLKMGRCRCRILEAESS